MLTNGEVTEEFAGINLVGPTESADVVVLGGAFRVNGNVHPAAEANIKADPEAANVVFSRCACVWGRGGCCLLEGGWV